MPVAKNNGELKLTFGPNSRIGRAYIESVRQLEYALYKVPSPDTLISIVDSFPSRIDKQYGEAFMNEINKNRPTFFSQGVQETREQVSLGLAATHDLTLLEFYKQIMVEHVAEYLEGRLLSTAKKLTDRLTDRFSISLLQFDALKSETISNNSEETREKNPFSALDGYLRRIEEQMSISNNSYEIEQALGKIKSIIYGLKDATLVFQSQDGQTYSHNRKNFIFRE